MSTLAQILKQYSETKYVILRNQLLYPPIFICILTTNIWMRWSKCICQQVPFVTIKTDHRQQNCRLIFYFLHFVKKSPVRGNVEFQRHYYTISIMYVLWLYTRSHREKVDLTLKICIRNKISHPLFVVKKPKLVISLRDNE